ncbi:hypothetical protein Chor_002612 [Crotalus horridus]
MEEFGPTSLFASEYKNETYHNSNETDSNDTQIPHITNFTFIFMVVLLTLCFLGLLGNGKVIWILGFHMKMNSFSIYVLNLAVADSGVLIMEVLVQIIQIHDLNDFTAYYIFSLLYFVLYNASQLLLLSISVDRCVSVLFPIWHQCHRPPKLSLIVCVITWVLSFVYFALEMSFHPWFEHMIILAMLSDICIVVNSSINPILYFLAGRNKEDRSRVSMNLALRRVFRNEEDIKEEKNEPDETQL